MPATLTAKSIVAELKTLGSASYRKTMLVHGAQEPIYGVKISDLKLIQKRAGVTNHQLALELWDTGIYDAMYLAALMADDASMSKRDLQRWLDGATSAALAEYSVPWVAAGSPHGWELGRKWIDSKQEAVAAAGWNTLGGVVSLTPDEELDLAEVKALLARVGKTIHSAPDRVRYVMNGFVIVVGSHVKPLTDEAVKVAKAIGTVEVDMGDTSCKVPDAAAYIDKVRKKGTLGKKRKTVKC
jgi:3-methyladenine DNA glycosylase AlkD